MKPVKELIAVPEEIKDECAGCCFYDNGHGCMAANRFSDLCGEEHHIYKVVPIHRLEDAESIVIEMIKERQKLGVKKYGMTLAENPLSLKEWLTHSLEEKLDDILYTMRAIQELEKNDT